MGMERRSNVKQFYMLTNLKENELMNKTKPFDIPKRLVLEAFEIVKSNKGSAGIDEESIKEFELNLSKNLYKLWNRLSSGTYFPPNVKGVEIPKKQGGKRILGIPTVTDRIAQTIVKLMFEPNLEKVFLEDSYGYRANKSALDAVGITRLRCWKYDWCVEFDIKGLFDNIDHELLMKAVRKHTDVRWVILYIERWIKAPMQKSDGEIINRTCGVPQGGVISPVLSNLFLHYAFDMWMTRKHKDKPWCRYADDGIAHCRSEAEAKQLMLELSLRFIECKLEIHPEKTKIIYCKDGRRKGEYQNTKFNFLGYEFRRRTVVNKEKKLFTGFNPAISPESKKHIIKTIRKTGIRNRNELSIEAVAKFLNPKIRGWINYYGEYTKSALDDVMRQINIMLVGWCKNKYDRFKKSKVKAAKFLRTIEEKQPNLFIHWKLRKAGMFV